MYDITTFGEILIDFTCQGKTVNGQRVFVQNPGGAPANVAVAAARLGGKTAFLGKAGKDMHGEFLKQTLEKEKVDIRGMLLDENWFTTLAFVTLDEKGERSFAFARKPGADTQIKKEELNMEILKNTKIFHIGSLPLTSEPARSTALYAIDVAKKAGAVISYDPNYRASLWENEQKARDELRSILSLANIIKISDEEIELLTGERKPEKAAQILIEQGIGLVAVTMGQQGAYIKNREGGCRVLGFQCQTVDTTGAGDAFWGTFLYQLSSSKKKLSEITLKEVIDFTYFSNSAASLCIERSGGIPAMPERTEIIRRMHQSMQNL